MAACMVTCGRGLDDFVRQEILEKIPGAVDLRHLGEGKLAFKVCQALDTTDNASVLGQTTSRGRLDDEEASKGARRELSVTSTASKKLAGTKEMIEEQEAASQSITEPTGVPAEEEDQWVIAVSHIFKLRLVERVFLLLHCEDIGPENGYHAGVGNSRPKDIQREYESKIKSFIEITQWSDLAVKLKRVKAHQDGERSHQVWCQDPDSCPGSLRRRQTNRELEEKRAASVSSDGKPGSFPRLRREDTNNTGCQRKKIKVHEDNEISNIDLKPTIPNNICKYENANTQGISGNNVSENYEVCGSVKFTQENDLNNKTQHSKRSLKKDPKNLCGDHEETNPYENKLVIPTDVNPEKGKVDVLTEESKSPLSTVFKDHCPPSQMDPASEEVEKIQDVKGSSSEHVTSTFRVSSRVSGPNKHILKVMWINHILSQQLAKAMAGWVPDRRQPIVDLYVNITSSHYIVGAALSSRPLSLRPYIPHLTLRSTISHLMASLSCLPPEAIVLDPMCGGGSILVETAMSFDVSHVIASDSSREQLEVARCNLHNLRVPVTLLQADAQELPLQASSVNTVLCDFPFGQKHKLTTESQQLLAEVLRETHRVLVCGGHAVFLLSPRQSEVVSQLANDKTKTSSTICFGAGGGLILLETHFVSLGETSACVAVLAKEHLS